MVYMKLENENMQLQEKLNEQNRLYYIDFLAEMRTKSLFKANKAAEEMSLVVLQDILEAQEKNILAADYFGEDAKDLAKNISKELSVEFRLFDTLGYSVLYIGIYLLFLGVGNLFNRHVSLDLLIVVASTIICTLTNVALHKMIGKSAYYIKNRRFVRLIVFGIEIGLLAFIAFFVKSTIVFSIPTLAYFGISFMFFVLFSAIVYRSLHAH